MTTRAAGSGEVALLGVPIDMGASQRGTLMGPAALRTAGIKPVLESLGIEVRDHGDISIAASRAATDPIPANANHYRDIQAWARDPQPARL